jgi:NitT/TauT family transport system permease protein
MNNATPMPLSRPTTSPLERAWTEPSPTVSKAPRPLRVRWFELRQDIPAWATKGLAALSFATLLAGWAWLSHQDFVNPVFLPTPERVWDAVRSLQEDGLLWADLKTSVFRVTAGFLLSALIALPLGVFVGSFKALEALFQPITEFIRYIPVPALIPMVMVCFGIGEMAKVMLIFIGTFFQLTLMVADEIRRVQYDLVQVSYTLGARRGEVMRLVLWRAAMPGIFDALRLCNGWAWTYLVVAELVAANEGLGYRILKFSRFLQTPKILLYLLLLGAVGLSLDILFRRFNARYFHWANVTKK